MAQKKLLRHKISFIGAICQSLCQSFVIKFIANDELVEIMPRLRLLPNVGDKDQLLLN
jgi:hypothetical protein